MTVRKRKGGGRWRVDVVGWQGGERVRLKRSAKTREEGVRIEGELRAQLHDGHAVAPTKVPTFAEWAKEFLEVYVPANNKPSEQQTKKVLVDLHLVPAFGPTRLDRIHEGAVDRYKATKLAADYSPKTVNNHLTVLRRMLTIAVRWKRVTGAPPTIALLKVPKSPFRFLDFVEAEQVIASADPEWRSMVLFAVRTGLRIGELLALRWEDVDLSKGSLVVRRTVYRGKLGTPKSGKERDVPLSSDALGALRGLPSRFAKGWVFGSGKTMLTPGLVKWPLYRATTRAGLGKLGWHVLRHTFASHLVMRGVPLLSVRDLLGHTDIVTTQRYAHLSPTVGRDAVNRLDEAPPAHAAAK